MWWWWGGGRGVDLGPCILHNHAYISNFGGFFIHHSFTLTYIYTHNAHEEAHTHTHMDIHTHKHKLTHTHTNTHTYFLTPQGREISKCKENV